MTKIYYTSFNSKIGIVHIASTTVGVCKISIPGQTKKEFLAWLQKKFAGADLIETSTKNRQIIDELNRYFDRRLVKFHSRLDPVGTEFQRRVWLELKGTCKARGTAARVSSGRKSQWFESASDCCSMPSSYRIEFKTYRLRGRIKDERISS
jgi:hypothetical protein